MNKITWLHLSDIHFSPRNEWRAEPARQALLRFLADKWRQDSTLKPDFIVCTGDIAFGQMAQSSMAEQYQSAAKFFDEVLACCGCDKTRLFLVPGNHDVDRDEINPDAQTHLIVKADQSDNHVATINQGFANRDKITRDALTRLQPYQQFIQAYAPHQHDEEGRCFYSQRFTVSNIAIGICGFNSVWSCAGDRDEGHLWFAGEWQFNQAKQQLKGQQLNIGLIHHPITWLAQAERLLVTARSERDFDFFLHGHTHEAWLNNGNGLITISTGAVGADDDREFGINITQLDLNEEQGKTHLFTYSRRHDEWQSTNIPLKAPQGVWSYPLPGSLKPAPVDHDQPTPPANPAAKPHKTTLFGRDKLLSQAAKHLQQNNCLLVYGMRGNGKSVFIDELSQRPPLQATVQVRIPVNRSTNAGDIYQQLARNIGDHRENISVPSGTVADISAALSGFRRDEQPYCIWLENAHQLFTGNNFTDPQLRVLLLALREFLPHCYWIFELRERPVVGLVPNCEALEMPGLDKASLAAYLLAKAPADAKDKGPTDPNTWQYQGDKLRNIYQWLGGGHGQQAHPLATKLLIEVALGLTETPYQVLRRRLAQYEQQLEDFLLNDLYHQVLTAPQQQLFCTLALYRIPIPEDHIEKLEQSLKLDNGWDGLNQRCLLASDHEVSKYYLHGFIAGWLRQLQGYPIEDEGYHELPASLASTERDVLARQHSIAQCWIDSVEGRKRVSTQTINITNEALFHLVNAGEFERLSEVAVHMLGADTETVYNRVFALYQHLHQIKAPLSQARALLTFLIQLKPQEAILYRFLGTSWRAEKGWQDQRVLDNFKICTEKQPDRPDTWANYGKACLQQQLAKQFLAELAIYEQSSAAPTGINGYVLAVKADCMTACGDNEGAFNLRQQLIISRTDNPAIYVDQAKAYLAQHKFALALDVLALAEQNGARDHHTLNIKSHILAQAGDKDGAMALRQQQIDSASPDPTFYNDQAQAYLAQQQPQQALAVLQLAQDNSALDDYSLSIKAMALDQDGQTAQAMALRQQQIDNRSTNPVFYAGQAEAYLSQQQPEQALQILRLAEENGAANDVTQRIKADVQRRLAR